MSVRPRRTPVDKKEGARELGNCGSIITPAGIYGTGQELAKNRPGAGQESAGPTAGPAGAAESAGTAASTAARGREPLVIGIETGYGPIATDFDSHERNRRDGSIKSRAAGIREWQVSCQRAAGARPGLGLGLASGSGIRMAPPFRSLLIMIMINLRAQWRRVALHSHLQLPTGVPFRSYKHPATHPGPP